MKSRLMKFAGVICLSVVIGGTALAQTQTPGMPDVHKLERSAVKLAIVGAAVPVAIGVLRFAVHHAHRSQSKKKSAYKVAGVKLAPSSDGASVARVKLSDDALTSGHN